MSSLTVRVTAVYFVKTSRRVAGPLLMTGAPARTSWHERSGLRAVELAGARLSFLNEDSHAASLFMECMKRSNRNGWR